MLIMHRGYVKVWRKIQDSGLMQMPNTLALFMHLLFNATHKDIKAGTSTGVIDLKRGQYIDGLNRLSASLKQTPRQIRTSQQRLIDLGIITIKTTNKYSIYTIENYNKYQDSDTQDDKQTTNKRQTNDKQTTTKQEYNNLNTKEVIQDLLSEVSENLLNEWLAVRKAKKGSPLSQTVLNALRRESKKAGLTVEQAVTVCIERNWMAFKEEWYSSSINKGYTNKRDESIRVAASSIFTPENTKHLRINTITEKDVFDA
jgi:hypothetical protein